jgi:hypothetical protein
MKLPVLGGMTQAEGVALGAFSTSGAAARERLPSVDLGAHGILLENGMRCNTAVAAADHFACFSCMTRMAWVLHGGKRASLPAPLLTASRNAGDHGAGEYTPAPFERVHTISAWVVHYVLQRRREGGIAVPPPVMARMHSIMSDAMHGYEQCRAIVRSSSALPCCVVFAGTLAREDVGRNTGVRAVLGGGALLAQFTESCIFRMWLHMNVTKDVFQLLQVSV